MNEMTGMEENASWLALMAAGWLFFLLFWRSVIDGKQSSIIGERSEATG